MKKNFKERSKTYQVLRVILLPFYRLFKYGPGEFWNDVDYAFKHLRYWKIYNNYPEWIKKFELDREKILRQKKQSSKFSNQFKFSFITPVFNPPVDIFIEMLDSVIAQTYPNWELCLANGGTDANIKQVILEYQSRDKRIKTINLVNKGISGNSNEALKLSTGDYLVLLDHDDKIAPDLLFEAAVRLNRSQNIDLIYYNEDKIELDGSRVEPRIKPRKFRYKQFLYSNFLNHCIIKRDMINRIGTFLDPKMDGAQDWDFFYKCIEITDKIVFIPRFLYSWRKIKGSAALDDIQKPYVFEKQSAARKAHVDRVAKNKLLKQGTNQKFSA